MLDLICGMCGQPIRMAERAVGHRARCRGCGTEFVVPPRAERGPTVVKPAGEPEITSRAAPPAIDLSLTPADASGGAYDIVTLPEERSPARAPAGAADEKAQERLDEEFLAELETERRRHIMTGQFTPHRRRTVSQQRTRLALAVFGGVTAVIAVVVLFVVMFLAGGRKPPPKPQEPDPGAYPSTPQGPAAGQPTTPRTPRPPVRPTPAVPEAKLRLLGPPDFRADVDLNSAVISGHVLNEYDGLIEVAHVTVRMQTDDGRSLGAAAGVAKLVPPGGRAPFTISLDSINNGRVRTPTMDDYTVSGHPDQRTDWVELSVMAAPRIEEDLKRAAGEVENNTPFRVGHIRIMCDLYRADGPIVLQREATLRATDVMLRPGGHDSFTLTWTDADIHNEMLADHMTCRAIGRKLGD